MAGACSGSGSGSEAAPGSRVPQALGLHLRLAGTRRQVSGRRDAVSVTLGPQLPCLLESCLIGQGAFPTCTAKAGDRGSLSVRRSLEVRTLGAKAKPSSAHGYPRSGLATHTCPASPGPLCPSCDLSPEKEWSWPETPAGDVCRPPEGGEPGEHLQSEWSAGLQGQLCSLRRGHGREADHCSSPPAGPGTLPRRSASAGPRGPEGLVRGRDSTASSLSPAFTEVLGALTASG